MPELHEPPGAGVAELETPAAAAVGPRHTQADVHPGPRVEGRQTGHAEPVQRGVDTGLVRMRWHELDVAVVPPGLLVAQHPAREPLVVPPTVELVDPPAVVRIVPTPEDGDAPVRAERHEVVGRQVGHATQAMGQPAMTGWSGDL